MIWLLKLYIYKKKFSLYKIEATNYILNMYYDLFPTFKMELINYHSNMERQAISAKDISQLVDCCNDKTLAYARSFLVIMREWFKRKKADIYEHHKLMTTLLYNINDIEEFKKKFDKMIFYTWLKSKMTESNELKLAIFDSLSVEDFEYVFENATINKNNVPEREIKHYCEQHRLPWCRKSQIPCYFCLCDSCEQIPEEYRQINDYAQCTFCKLPTEKS